MDRWSVKEWLRGVARVRPRKPARRWTEVDTDERNKHFCLFGVERWAKNFRDRKPKTHKQKGRERS